MKRWERIVTRRFVLAALAVCSLPLTASAGRPLVFEFPLEEVVYRHLDIFEFPPYLAAALETNGVKLSNSGGKTEIVDERTVAVVARERVSLRFLSRDGSRFLYKVEMEWGPGSRPVRFSVPVELDFSTKGKAVLKAQLPLTGLFPDELVVKARDKIAALCGKPDLQARLAAYLDEMGGFRSPDGGIKGSLDMILFRAYNKARAAGALPNGAVWQPGDADPASVWIPFAITALIWFFIAPSAILIFWFVRFRRRSKLIRSLPARASI